MVMETAVSRHRQHSDLVGVMSSCVSFKKKAVVRVRLALPAPAPALVTEVQQAPHSDLCHQ